MAKIARAFDKHTRGAIHRPLPRETALQDNDGPPWELVAPGVMPPMMFQLRFHDGSKSSFAYSDLREVYCRDPGYVALTVQSVAKYRIEIEGRHLSGLADYFGMASVRWVQEGDPRCDPSPESAPKIVRISAELLPD